MPWVGLMCDWNQTSRYTCIFTSYTCTLDNFWSWFNPLKLGQKHLIKPQSLQHLSRQPHHPRISHHLDNQIPQCSIYGQLSLDPTNTYFVPQKLLSLLCSLCLLYRFHINTWSNVQANCNHPNHKGLHPKNIIGT